MRAAELKKITKVPQTVAIDLVKVIRLLAMTGKKVFQKHLFEPLDYGGWKRRPSNETIHKMMDRINRYVKDKGAVHTVGPHCKRLISQAMNESPAHLGDSSIFFLEKIQESTMVASGREAIEFVQTIHGPLTEFQDNHRNRTEKIFEESLNAISNDDLREAFQPVDLGRSAMRVEMERQAIDLFNRIKIATKDDDLVRCRKLIAAYLIKYGDQIKNNREEVEQVITAFQSRDETFRQALEDSIAINLYYDIQTSISKGNIKGTIIAIRKYAHIFEGNPDVKYFNDIDVLEQKLYNLITAKDLWDELKDR